MNKKYMKKIISIDFDIIMSPSIQLYNDSVPSNDWDELLKNPHMQLLNADLNTYSNIFKLLIKCCEQMDAKNIHFITNHEELLNYVDDKDELSIVNIDHHHDIAYNDEEDFSEFTCANWVGVLFDQKVLKEYIWINNYSSQDPSLAISKLFEFKRFCVKEFNVLDLDIPDELFICLSPPWIPPYNRPLFDLLVHYCESHFNQKFIVESGGFINE